MRHGFYSHVTDTMRRTPGATFNSSVFDHLVPDETEMQSQWASVGPTWEFAARLPRSGADVWRDLQELLGMKRGLGVPKAELEFFLQRLVVMAGACPSRWEEAGLFEETSYWAFHHAANLSKAYGKFLVKGITRNIVAAKAETCSLRTIGKTFIRLLTSILRDVLTRVLDRPTNEAWIDPWHAHLKKLGVRIVTRAAASALNVRNGKIDSITVTRTDATGAATEEQRVVADHYVMAVPVEQMVPLTSTALAAAAPSLRGLARLQTAWMNGIQFFLPRDITMVRGHVGYYDSPWALSSVSQSQFWKGFNWSAHGDGSTRGVLSVDISDWMAAANGDGPAGHRAAANATSRAMVQEEVWHQLHRLLPDTFPAGGASALTAWSLDPDITFGANGAAAGKGWPMRATDGEPLLINTVGSLTLRPNATTEVPNLFLAADFVRTTTDVACMEAANEAARRAVNGILSAEARTDRVPLCDGVSFTLWICNGGIR